MQQQRSDGDMFSVVCLCVCPFVCLSVCVSVRLSMQKLLNRLRYHHEILTRARYGQKLGRLQKWLRSDALPYESSDLTLLTLLFLCVLHLSQVVHMRVVI